MIGVIEDIFNRVMEGDIPTIFKLATAWVLFFTVKYHIELLGIAKWPSVIGNLTHFEFLIHQHSNLSPTRKIRYNFVVNGIEYDSRQLAYVTIGGRGLQSYQQKMMEQVERIDQDKVVLYYNPRNPKKSVLLKPGRIEFGFLCSLYIGAALCAYVGFIE